MKRQLLIRLSVNYTFVLICGLKLEVQVFNISQFTVIWHLTCKLSLSDEGSHLDIQSQGSYLPPYLS